MRSAAGFRTLVHWAALGVAALGGAAWGGAGGTPESAGAAAGPGVAGGPDGAGDDSDALSLSSDAACDVTPKAAAVMLEAAQTATAARGVAEAFSGRLSADARLDARIADGWRGVLAERIDDDWQGSVRNEQPIGTLKEAYVSWEPGIVSFDVGRINVRQGVGFGYNPTDSFRADSVRSIVSPDPNSLRENRLGTFMLRSQALWNGGALTMVYAPQLSEHGSSAALDPDIAATNSHDRWQVGLSQTLAPGWMPQWLVFGGAGTPPQVGLNLTALAGASTVAYVEVAVGRSPTLLAQALNLPGDGALRPRATAGATYTLANKLSLTLELEFNAAGLGSRRWSALGAGDPEVYGRYREYSGQQQDLPTRSNVFAYAAWQDLLIRHVDLAGFVRLDPIDHSRLAWLELRHHWNRVDLALRWQDAGGDRVSDLGAAGQRQTWQALVDYYP